MKFLRQKKSINIVSIIQACDYSERDTLTCFSAVESNFNTVPSLFPTSQMHRLMQVTKKVDKEFEGFFRRTIAFVLVDPTLQHACDIFDSVEDIGLTLPVPSTRARKEAALGWVIVNGVDVMQSAGPFHAAFDFICPRGYGGEMAS
jgi:hypothetical protein